MSIFHKDAKHYTRNYNLVGSIIEQVATAISVRFNVSIESAREYSKNVIRSDGRFPLKNPRVRYVGKDNNGDRVEKETTLLDYIKVVDDNKFIMSPSMNVYTNKQQKASISSKYIREGKALRKKYKTAMFKAKAANDKFMSTLYNKMQKNKKINNNSLSGAHSSKSTILFMKSIHHSLTSMCRCASGYANANNEKIIMGNRHYATPEITLANVNYIVTRFNRKELDLTMKHYELVVPTVDDVMECITKSTNKYWRDERILQIHEYVQRLDDLQRSAVVYLNDFYHVAKHNPDVVKKLVAELTEWDEDGEIPEVDDKIIKGLLRELGEEATLLAALLVADKFKTVRDVNDINNATREEMELCYRAVKNLHDNLPKYKNFFSTIFANDVRINNVSQLKYIHRECAITSDTDSTLYTTEWWHKWYTDDKDPAKNDKISHFINYIASSSIIHVLAHLSANVGVAEDELFGYTMKSEYFFPVFVITVRTKTYFGDQGSQEGVINIEPETEVKGAVLKGSTNAGMVMADSKKKLREILDTVKVGKKVDLPKYLKEVGELELKLKEFILKGDKAFFKRLQLNDATSYTQEPHRSNYFNHILWNEVFAPKYGGEPNTPYVTLRVSLDLPNKTSFESWLKEIDPEVADRLVKTLKKYGKPAIKTLCIPYSILDKMGTLPEEIQKALAVRTMIYRIMEQHYVMLESLGYYSLGKEPNRMIMDLIED